MHRLQMRYITRTKGISIKGYDIRDSSNESRSNSWVGGSSSQGRYLLYQPYQHQDQFSKTIHISLQITDVGQLSYNNYPRQSSIQPLRGSTSSYSSHGGYFGPVGSLLASVKYMDVLSLWSLWIFLKRVPHHGAIVHSA